METLQAIPDTKTICATCETHMSGNRSAKRISHGVCKECYKGYCKQLGHCLASSLKDRSLLCGECGTKGDL